MEKKFKITMPELKINKEQRIKEIKAILYEDFEKGGILNQCIAFLYNFEVATSTEMSDAMTSYYKKEINRSMIFRNLYRLEKMDIVIVRDASFLIMTPYDQLNEVERFMLAKYRKFLDKIAEAYKNRYTNVKFFALANGFGLEFIEYSCKILNFKCE